MTDDARTAPAAHDRRMLLPREEWMRLRGWARPLGQARLRPWVKAVAVGYPLAAAAGIVASTQLVPGGTSVGDNALAAVTLALMLPYAAATVWLVFEASRGRFRKPPRPGVPLRLRVRTGGEAATVEGAAWRVALRAGQWTGRPDGIDVAVGGAAVRLRVPVLEQFR